MIDLLMFNQDYGRASALGVIMIAILVAYAVFYLRATDYEKGSDF
jgi:ABC-type sugar transport system permease subunit